MVYPALRRALEADGRSALGAIRCAGWDHAATVLARQTSRRIDVEAMQKTRTSHLDTHVLEKLPHFACLCAAERGLQV